MRPLTDAPSELRQLARERRLAYDEQYIGFDLYDYDPRLTGPDGAGQHVADLYQRDGTRYGVSAEELSWYTRTHREPTIR